MLNELFGKPKQQGIKMNQAQCGQSLQDNQVICDPPRLSQLEEVTRDVSNATCNLRESLSQLGSMLIPVMKPEMPATNKKDLIVPEYSTRAAANLQKEALLINAAFETVKDMIERLEV